MNKLMKKNEKHMQGEDGEREVDAIEEMWH